MELLSRGWRTDLGLLTHSGSDVEHHPTFVVVRTPANPTFRWGNFLLLRRAPGAHDVSRLEDLFTRHLPGLGHRAFGIDAPDAELSDLRPFAQVGYAVEMATVLTADRVHPPRRPNTNVQVRQLTAEHDWEQRFGLDLACNGGGEAFEEFARRKCAAERQMTDDGHGAWFGAFDAGRLVATLGVLRADDELARYQEVQTHPESRGRGLAGTLVHAAGQHALDELGSGKLIIVADPDYPAIRIYRSVGFADAETQLQAECSPR